MCEWDRSGRHNSHGHCRFHTSYPPACELVAISGNSGNEGTCTAAHCGIRRNVSFVATYFYGI